MSRQNRLCQEGQKKLLAIDGGGVRGIISLEVLLEIEAKLRAQSGNPDLRLSDYFDYIAGTSTGGIIATGLAIGLGVQELLDFYQSLGPLMFERASLLNRLRHKYSDEPLARALQTVLGKDTTLGSDTIKTLLMLVMRNATTDSPWPLSNNPYGIFNDRARQDCNLDLPLWQLVRASTAAPTYFPPEVITLPAHDGRADRQFIFVDGAVTMYNNPAFQLFLMATLDRYWTGAPEGKRGWQTGRDRMLLVSVGPGTAAEAREGLGASDVNLLFNATNVPNALMFAAQNEQDLLCRVFGDCVAGGPIDEELGDLKKAYGPLSPPQKLFTYVRYNADLSAGGLADLGCDHVSPVFVHKLDAIEGFQQLREIGRAFAERHVEAEHFSLFPAGEMSPRR